MSRPFTKVITLFIATTFLLLSNSFAQSNKEDYKQISVEKAIAIITQKYQVTFSFSSDFINLQKKINLNTYQKNLENVLEQFSEQANVDYRVLSTQVILSPRKKAKNTTKATLYIHGYIRDIRTRELLPDILVFCSNNKNTVYTNNYGYYSIEIPANLDSVELQAHIVGYKYSRKVLSTDGKTLVNWDLENSIEIEDIEINDQRMEDKAFHKSLISDNVDDNIRERTPRLLGEKDALAATRYYAGVNRETDLSSGYNIRGGRTDQNLIILDDAPLYHSFHLFGLYSIFNEDALKQMNLIKGGFPARYGGRLSSVVELITKDGNMQDFKTEIGTGIIASRVGVEGPIIKDKLAFFVSGRFSHVSQLLSVISSDDSGTDLRYRFFDINTKFQWKINDKNRLFVSYYSGRDKFDGNEETASSGLSSEIKWGNQSATLRWNHIFHPKWFANTSFIYSNYYYGSDQSDTTFTLRFGSGVRDYTFKYDADYFHNDRHHFKFGVIATSHTYTPSKTVSFVNAFSSTTSDNSEDIFKTEEFAIYAEDEINLTKKISTNIGIRESGFKYRNTIKLNTEPRFLLTYLLSQKYAIKVSYGKMYQYAHYLNSFVGIGLPNDLWLPSTNELVPESSDQYSLGIYFNNRKHWKVNVEGFYKYQENILNYAPNSNLLSSLFDAEPSTSKSWADRTMSGEAKIYGVEFQLEYKKSRYKALTAYTLSFSKNYFDELKYGDWFWASNDRRHNFSIMNSFQFAKNWSVIASWIFTTGTPFTIPEASYSVSDHQPIGGGQLGSNYLIAYDYRGMNNYRMSSYHKLDVNINYTKEFEKSTFELNFGAMNVYNRKNSMYYQITYNEITEKNELKRMAFLGIVPSVTLNFKF